MMWSEIQICWHTMCLQSSLMLPDKRKTIFPLLSNGQFYKINPLFIRYYTDVARNENQRTNGLVNAIQMDMFKWWPWSDLDLFYCKVQFGNLGFSIGKWENSGYFRNYCSLIQAWVLWQLLSIHKMEICSSSSGNPITFLLPCHFVRRNIFI